MTTAIVDTLCRNGKDCADRVDGHARETTDPLCRRCINRTAERVREFPGQYQLLHEIVGDRQGSVDVAIKHQKPGGTVNVNVLVDSLMEEIADVLITAAEIVADAQDLRDADQLRLDPREHIVYDARQVPHRVRSSRERLIRRCTWIVNPNLQLLQQVKTVDVIEWNRNGTLWWPGTTTGWLLVQRLDKASASANYLLGQTKARTSRDLPCARCKAKTVGRWAGKDWYDCTSCGSLFPVDEIERQDKILYEMHKRGTLTAGSRA